MKLSAIGRLDSFGIFLSVACALHCVLPLVMLVVAPTLASEIAELEYAHIAFVLLVAPTAFFAFRNGYQAHASIWPGRLAVVGICLLLVSITVHEPHWLETAITLVGTTLMVGAHASNYRLCKSCPTCRAEPSSR